ncbi:hypothetical protein GCM10010306_069590 [Streptomyces umbrinus]|nr:hypothetical protein GCM10010306_069590 [Streptomyces umbrinus]
MEATALSLSRLSVLLSGREFSGFEFPGIEFSGIQFSGSDPAVRSDPHSERSGRPAPEGCQRLSGSAVADSQVKYAQAARTADGGGKPGFGFTERGDSNDHVLGAHSRRHDSPK